MPEALATTKRKFHRLLDSRFGPPTTQPAANHGAAVSESRDTQPTTSAEPATKRIRSGTASLASTSSRQLHPTVSSTSLASARSPSLTSLRSTTRPILSNNGATPLPPTREPPNFAPWSHAMFLTRLRTFGRVSQWHPKPEAVNEVQWAKRGWSCVDTNTVACKGGCGQRVLVDVEPVPRRRMDKETEEGDDEDEEEKADEEMEKALVERYTRLIVEGHAEGCLWRQAGCKSDIYRLPIVKTSVWQPELRDRYKTLLKIPEAFQNTHLKPDDLKPGMEKLLADLPGTLLALPDVVTDQEDSENTDSVEITPLARQHALLIALTGWRGVTESGTDLLCCDACFQRIGLWMYQPDYKRPHFTATTTDASSTANDDDDPEEQDRSLDLVDLHREHCPWRNADSQCASGDYAGQPAWKIMHLILERYADEYRRRSRGQVSRSRAVSEVVGTEIVVGDGEGASVAGELELMPDLTREETEKLDKERTSKLRRLKSVFGFNKARTVKRRESMLL